MHAGDQPGSIVRLAVLALALCLSTPVWASPPKEDLFAVVRDICTVSFKLAVAELQPLLDREPRLKNINTKVVFAADDEFMAEARFREKRVAVSQGFCYHNWLFNWAQALASISGTSSQLMAYGSYLANTAHTFTASGAQGEVQTFERFAQIDLSAIPKDRLATTQATAIVNMQGILAFAIAHEFGHLALDHQPASSLLPMDSRKQEYAADLFAMRLLTAERLKKYAEMGALLGLSMNTLAAREIGSKPAISSFHPPTFCRQALLDFQGKWLESLASDAKTKESFERSMGKSIEQMILMRRETLRGCPTP